MTLKPARKPARNGQGQGANGAVPHSLRSTLTEMNCDGVHRPSVGSKHWVFAPGLVDVVNQFTRSHLAALGIIS